MEVAAGRIQPSQNQGFGSRVRATGPGVGSARPHASAPGRVGPRAEAATEGQSHGQLVKFNSFKSHQQSELEVWFYRALARAD